MTPARIDTAIRAEFKKWRSKPRPQKDWGLLWVLSGYDTSWNAYSDTRRRLEEGMRLGKKIAKINGRKFPVLYVSGYDEHNTNLKQWHAEDVFEKEYAFPKNNLRIGPQEHIRHTGDQFELFPRRFLKGNKKIVIVTDAYHIPRVRRYVEKFFPAQREQFVFYPAQPIAMSPADVKRETKKIIGYSKKGIIPLFADTKKVVVSGATGFLGSHLLEELSASGNISVVPLGREAFKNRKLLRAKLAGADFVFHLAGVNRATDVKEYQFNVSSTKMLLRAVRGVAPRATFVYTSSFAVYQSPKKGQIVDERFPLRPRNVYGESKLATEGVIRTFSKRYGIPSIVLRISNMYGAHAKPSRAIVDQIRHAVHSGKAITVHTDPAATRDFIYVDDVVAALLRVIEHASGKSGFHVFNICTGEELSLADVIKLAEKIAGRKLNVEMHPDARESATFWRGSFQKAKKGLQWHPKVKVREGLHKTLI